MAVPIVPIAIVALIAAAAASGSRRRRGSTEIVFEDGDTITGGGGGGYTPGAGVGAGPISSYADMPMPISEGQALMREMFFELGLDPMWSMFFEATALNESGFNNLRGLGIPSEFPSWASPNEGASFQTQQNEADAAKRAYDRNKDKLAECGWPASRYTFGSGGWFALLPANAVMQARGTSLKCVDPWDVFDPATSVVLAIGMARNLQNWNNFKSVPTFGNLRLGWGNPSRMGKADKLREAKAKSKGFAARLGELGFDPAYFDAPVTPMPPYDPVAMLNYLNSRF